MVKYAVKSDNQQRVESLSTNLITVKWLNYLLISAPWQLAFNTAQRHKTWMTERIHTVMSAGDLFSVVSDTMDILPSTVSAWKNKTMHTTKWLDAVCVLIKELMVKICQFTTKCKSGRANYNQKMCVMTFKFVSHQI